MSAPRLVVPRAIWDDTTAVFATFSAAGLEGGCLWYGVPGTLRVVRLGVPRQRGRPRNFEIEPAALEELNAGIGDDLAVVAQLHGHPGWDVRHSPWDDDLIVSRRAVSIVLPWYGAHVDLAACGVHVHGPAGWSMLPPGDALASIEVVDDGGEARPTLDLRWP